MCKEQIFKKIGKLLVKYYPTLKILVNITILNTIVRKILVNTCKLHNKLKFKKNGKEKDQLFNRTIVLRSKQRRQEHKNIEKCKCP